MNLAGPVAVLFALNFIDAVLTLFWVRNGIAPEGNVLMASLLDMGDVPFLAFKLAMGTFAAIVFIYGANFKLARYGVAVGIAVYAGTILIHIFIGLTALDALTSAVSRPLVHLASFV